MYAISCPRKGHLSHLVPMTPRVSDDPACFSAKEQSDTQNDITIVVARKAFTSATRVWEWVTTFVSCQVWNQIHDRMNEGDTYRVKLRSDEVCESKVGFDLGLRKVQFLE